MASLSNDRVDPQPSNESSRPAESVDQDSVSADLVKDNAIVDTGISKTSSAIADEVLRARIREIIADKPASSPLERVAKNPLAPILLTFLLTGVLGTFLTNYITDKQRIADAERADKRHKDDLDREARQREIDQARADIQRDLDKKYQEGQRLIEYERIRELRRLDHATEERQKRVEHERSIERQEMEREKSFAEKMNEIRVPKIGSVWDRIFGFEVEVEKLSQEINAAVRKSISEHQALQKEFPPIILAKDREKLREYVDRLRARSRIEEEIRNKANQRYLIAKEDVTLHVLANRFWIGDKQYQGTMDYLRASDQYFQLVYGLGENPDKSDRVPFEEMEKRFEELALRKNRLRQSLVTLKSQMIKDKD